ncbi:DUF2442 domain-containing protein [Candidatus Electronema sp. PJ]|uniref:DUF2442 domain-containing protein n=1 Tax=Candidatus Electronema sp. PJ TaxID=3401572 RepID=UPI003AA7BFFC
MSTLVDVAAARFQDGYVVVTMASGLELRFPVERNPRLAGGTPAQLNNIEVSPFGLHWPDLDEDLSFRGLLAGDYGQSGRCPTSCAHERHAALLEKSY